MSIRKHLIAGALLATAATASIAFAQGQNQQTPMMGYGMMGHGMMGYGWGPGMMGYDGMGPGMMGNVGMGPGMMSYGPMMQGRLAYLKAELGITDAQKAEWDGYVDAVHARATTMQGMHATMMQTWQSGTALDRLEAHTQAMQAMLDSMKAIKPATDRRTGELWTSYDLLQSLRPLAACRRLGPRRLALRTWPAWPASCLLPERNPTRRIRLEDFRQKARGSLGMSVYAAVLCSCSGAGKCCQPLARVIWRVP